MMGNLLRQNSKAIAGAVVGGIAAAAMNFLGVEIPAEVQIPAIATLTAVVVWLAPRNSN